MKRNYNKNIYFILFLSLSFVLSFIAVNAYALDQDFFVEEHRKEIQQPAKVEASYTRDAYRKEREDLMNQIKIITGDEETKYFIEPGDTVTVTYQDRNEEKAAAYKVSSGGEIQLPLIGNVKVLGLNRKQTREKIDRMMKEYIRYPKVKVGINVDGRYIVTGAVSIPGVYELKPNLTLMEAVMGAGGYIRGESNIKSVVVMRGGIEKPDIQKYNLLKLVKKGDRTDNVLVKPGDLIHVPATFIHNFNIFKKDIFKYILDYYTLGGGVLIEQLHGP